MESNISKIIRLNKEEIPKSKINEKIHSIITSSNAIIDIGV